MATWNEIDENADELAYGLRGLLKILFLVPFVLVPLIIYRTVNPKKSEDRDAEA